MPTLSCIPRFVMLPLLPAANPSAAAQQAARLAFTPAMAAWSSCIVYH